MSTSGRFEALASSVTTSTFAGSFVDGLRSYQRSQLLLSGSNLPSGSESEGEEDNFEAGSSERSFIALEGDDLLVEGVRRDDSLLFGGELSGDEFDLDQTRNSVSDAQATSATRFANNGNVGERRQIPVPLQSEGRPSERSPLISNRVSFGTLPIPQTGQSSTPYRRPFESARDAVGKASQSSGRTRRPSQGRSTTSLHITGSSTFGQTLFNTIAALVGIGILSEPLAFAYAGWLGGAALLAFYAFVACYTAILLTNIMFSDSKIKTYADIGRKAFGKKLVPFISLLFCLELFSLSVVLVTLFADSLGAILPSRSKTAYKLLSLAIIVPTSLLPLSLLAYTSVIGILSTVLIIFVLLFDGLGLDFVKTGTAFGLFMAGFSGHAIVPSLALDMKDPTQFSRMIQWAFAISTLLYAAAGATGYLMFGESVSDEISQDLIAMPEYSKAWNSTLMWMLVVMPISKFALGTRPLSTTFEGYLGVDNVYSGVIESSSVFLVRVFSRSATAAAAVAISIAIPEFSTVMAFLGSFSAFTICIIGPISAHIQINGMRWWDLGILLIAVLMAVWGTVAAFMP